MSEWDREKQELLAYHDQLRGRVAALEAELGRLLNSFEEDEVLWRVRKALEIILDELCGAVLQRQPIGAKDSLQGIIDQLKGKIPEPVCNAMHTLRGLGNRGTHTKAEPISSREVRTAFLALATVLHWYVVEYKAITPASDNPAETIPVLNPYRGLDVFEEKDADRFFGRERYLDEALWPAYQALDAAPARLQALIGPSGSGKSSLARAGLLPLLKQRLPAGRFLVTIPTNKPLEALASALAQQASPDDPLPAAKQQEFLHLMQSDDHSLRRIIELLYERDQQPRVLLVDQFEETFTLCKDLEQRGQYLANLLNAIDGPAARLTLLLTLRSDFLGETQSHPEFNQTLSRQAHLVPVLDEDGLRRAITEPARRAGRPLDDAVTHLLMEQSEGTEGVLPLLQYALTEIWRGLEQGHAAADTLTQIGGVGGALAGRAQAIYQKLSEAEQAIARRAFLKLVQLGEGGQDTRRRVALDDLIAEGESRDTVRAILHQFAARDARFLTFGQDAGIDSVEITHDALIQHWLDLREWLNNNRDDLRLLNRLDSAAKHWQAEQRPRGLLWRRPDLDLLRQLAQRRANEFTKTQADFHRASIREERRTTWLKRGAVLSLAALTVTAGWFWREADMQRKEALRQKEQAAQNFSRARQAVDEFYTQISENKLLNEPKMESLRRELLEKALKFYQELAAQYGDDPQMQAEIGKAQFRLGNIKTTLGDIAGAKEAYREAIEIQQRLAREYSEVTQYKSDLAMSHLSLGLLQNKEGDAAGSQESTRKAIAIFEGLVQAHPELPEYQQKLAVSQISLGDLQSEGGDRNGAIDSYYKALEVCERLAQGHHGVPEGLLPYIRGKIAKYKNQDGDLIGARETYRKSLADYERLAREHPEAWVYKKLLADSHEKMGHRQSELGDKAGAMISYQEALKVRNKLVEEHPDIPSNQNDLAEIHINLGELQSDQGDKPGALGAYKKATEIREKLGQNFSDVPEYQDDLARTHNSLGNLQSSEGDRSGALGSYQKAFTIREKLVGKYPQMPDYRNRLATIHVNIGNLQREGGDTAAAMLSYQQAVDILTSLTHDFPKAQEYQNALGEGLYNLAYYQSSFDTKKARETFLKAIEVCGRYPKVPDFQNCLALSHGMLGKLQYAAKETEGALTSSQKAIEIYERLVEQYPGIPKYKLALSLLLGQMSWLELTSSHFQEAVKSATRGLEIDPSQTPIKVNLAHGLLFSGQYANALVIYTENKDTKLDGAKLFAQAVLDDFKQFRAQGITHPDMAKIEKLLREGKQP